jgi:hypothetical protein
MADHREHLRCPACGKLSSPERFEEQHRVELLVQSFIGGGNEGWRADATTKKDRRIARAETGEKGKGFEWRKRPLTDDDLALIERAVRRAVALVVEAKGGEPEPEFEPTATTTERELRRLVQAYVDYGFRDVEMRLAEAAQVFKERGFTDAARETKARLAELKRAFRSTESP